MNPLARRIEELRGFHVRLHIAEGKAVATVDGVCAGIEQDCIVLIPSSAGERTDVALDRVYAVTQLPGEFPDGHAASTAG